MIQFGLSKDFFRAEICNYALNFAIQAVLCYSVEKLRGHCSVLGCKTGRGSCEDRSQKNASLKPCIKPNNSQN